MATHPVSDCYYAGMVTPVFDLEKTLSTSLRLIRRASAIWALHMLKMGCIISSYTVKQAAFDLQQKETGSKTVAIATSNYASCGAFLSAQLASQIPIVLHHYLQRYSLFCVLTSILTHLMTSSVPWISLERDEIWQKGKCHSSSLLKAFQIGIFFNTSIFHFIGTLKKIKKLYYYHYHYDDDDDDDYYYYYNYYCYQY